jgi:outer membrane protein assembly factor BamA
MALSQTGIFENVEADIRPMKRKDKPNAVQIIFKFATRDFPPMESLRIEGATILPSNIVDKVMKEYKTRGGGKVDMKTIALMKNIIEGYYQERGFAYSYITHFEGMEGGHVVANVSEGKVKSVKVVPVDDVGNLTETGELSLHMIEQDVRNTLKEGELFSVDNTRKALRDVFATQLFENVQVLQKPLDDPAFQHYIDVEVLVKERAAKSAEIEMEWQVQPGNKGHPAITTLAPGGSLLFQHRNLGGNGSQFSATINTHNFLNPADDLGFKLEFQKPYCLGTGDPNRTSLGVSALNTRKISNVFISSGVEIPPVWVDRAGVKVSLAQQYSRNSKGSISLVAQAICCREESGNLCATGQRNNVDGHHSSGPPTTLCGSGSDKVVFVQCDIVRDATYFNHGAILGPRDILTVEQGGIGSGFPFFNRSILSMTRFIPLNQLLIRSKTPPSLIIHIRGGNCLGASASYDYFTLGGTFSCRGYNKAELGSGRRFIETATELRYPLPKMDGQIYSFFEHADSLGSGEELRGNPSEFCWQSGRGSSWGYGVKFAGIRFENARDCNIGEWTWFIRFGERF